MKQDLITLESAACVRAETMLKIRRSINDSVVFSIKMKSFSPIVKALFDQTSEFMDMTTSKINRHVLEQFHENSLIDGSYNRPIVLSY